MSEAIRVLNICNACRYCEGHCAVFPALESRLVLDQADVDALAHLCHQCGACYHNCQYAPPHEFAVNLPSVLERERQESFARLGTAALAVSKPMATAVTSTLIAVLLFAVAIHSENHLFLKTDNFYDLMPHKVMAGTFGFAGVLVLTSWFFSGARFWRTLRLPAPWRINAGTWLSAIHDALTLKNLDGGHGAGCHVESDAPTLARRYYHHCVLAGFLLCFAATASGTLLHYIWQLPAPYDWVSLPKLFGMPGGILLIIGCLGLLVTGSKTVADTQYRRGFTSTLTWLLLPVAVSGLALPVLKGTTLLGSALAIHLGLVLGLFVNFAWGKFQHSLFRPMALLSAQYLSNK